ncbi:MAG: S-layer homology domain-containing protein [Clostridia bacterium]|nr:S-layer homology domain-containing protein [Clostridia bacterium]
MKRKKMIAFILTALILLTNVFTGTSLVFAAPNPDDHYITIEMDRYFADVGDIIKASVKVNKIDGLSQAFQINIKYDPNVLQPVNPNTGAAYTNTTKPLDGDIFKDADLTTVTHNLNNGILNFGKSFIGERPAEETGTLGVIGFKVLKKQQTEVKFENSAAMPNSVLGTSLYIKAGSPALMGYALIQPEPINAPVGVKIDSTKVKAGDTVNIPVVFNSIPQKGITGANFTLGFSEKLVNEADITVEPGSLITSLGSKARLLDSKRSVEGYKLVTFFYSDSTAGTLALKGSGTFCTVKLKIKRDAPSDKYYIIEHPTSSFSDTSLHSTIGRFDLGYIEVEGTTQTPQPTATSMPTNTPTPTSNQGGNPPVVTSVPVATPVAKPTNTPTPVIDGPNGNNNIPGAPVDDYSISLSADKAIYEEQQTITYTIDFKNNTNIDITGLKVIAQIPQYTKISDISGGTAKGNTVEWNVDELGANESKQIVYKLISEQLRDAQYIVSNEAVLAKADNSEELTSSELKTLIYSNRFENAVHEAYVGGYKDKTFKPENQVTRAEVATMLSKVLKLPLEEVNADVYKDVKKKDWSSKYVKAVTDAGLFKGDKGNTFRPNAPITRAELSAVIARYMNLPDVDPVEKHFSDVQKHWALKAIEQVYRIKVISGYKDGTFKPDSKIKRSEVVTMLNRMLFRGPLKGVDTPFKDVKKTHWAYGQIVESTVTHKFTRDKDSNEVYAK